MTLLPRASSLIAMSATLIRRLVSLFSGRAVKLVVRLNASGGSLTSVISRLNAAVTGGLPGRAGSLADTVTA